MKKILSFMVMALVLLLPLTTKADVKIVKSSCTKQDANMEKTCTVKAEIDDELTNSLQVQVTEEGGAEISSIDSVSTSDWRVTNKSESGTVWTVDLGLTGPGQTGEVELFTITYKVSGTKDCKIRIKLNNVETTIEPEPEKDVPKGKCTYNKSENKYYIDGVEVTESQYKEQCPKTGSTLPYIALGAMVVLAAAAYVATKNKTKMYKI